MTLIHTCELNGINAFDYLNQLQLQTVDVALHPEHWMPWNYRDNVADGDGHTDGLPPQTCATPVAECST